MRRDCEVRPLGKERAQRRACGVLLSEGPEAGGVKRAGDLRGEVRFPRAAGEVSGALKDGEGFLRLLP